MTQAHPPWQAGDYADYVLERDDGSWMAFHLRLMKPEGSIWPLLAYTKTEHTDGTVLFRCDDRAPAEQFQVHPVRIGTSRGDGSSDDGPMVGATLIMNLMIPRLATRAREALGGQSTPVDGACGIDRIWNFISDGPGYQKHHYLSPKVPITGVAAMFTDGTHNPLSLVACGNNDGETKPGIYSDYVDLSRHKTIHHDGFELAYPASWHLQTLNHQAEGQIDLVAQMGGNSCAANLGIAIIDGPAATARERAAFLERVSRSTDTVIRRPPEAMENPQVLLADLRGERIDGVLIHAMHQHPSEDRLIIVRLFGCILKTSPRRNAVLTDFEETFRTIQATFRFS